MDERVLAKEADARTIKALAVVATLCFLSTFLLTKLEWITFASAAGLLGAAGVLSAMIMIGTIESGLREPFARFYSLRYLCVSLFAIAVYVARLQGFSDINAIFHIDAGALPLTVWAATILNMFRLLTPVIVLGLALSGFLWVYHARSSDDESAPLQWMWLVCALGFAILWLIAAARLGDDQRKQFLYRLSQEADFVASFRCDGVDEQGVVGLFIGPEQRRVLLAPIIKDSGFSFRNMPRLFKPVTIPSEFPIVECAAPKTDMSRWRRNHVPE